MVANRILRYIFVAYRFALPGVLPMMDDHLLLCRVRNELADALKVLLNAEIMDAADFSRSRDHAINAIAALDVLLRFPHRDEA